MSTPFDGPSIARVAKGVPFLSRACGLLVLSLTLFMWALGPEGPTALGHPPSASIHPVDSTDLPSRAGLRLALTGPNPSFSFSSGPRVASNNRLNDRWLGRDKAKHVVVSALWTVSTQYVLVNKADWSEPDALPASITSAATLGLTKEMYDVSEESGHFCGRDLVADAVGIALAVGLIKL